MPVTYLATLAQQLSDGLGIEGLSLPTTAVKFYHCDDSIPELLRQHQPGSITLTSCQATKQASLGDAVLLTLENIGCIAAAITFGLVDQNQPTPLEGARVYTDIMHEQSGLEEHFQPPTPQDFTAGRVYACADAQRPEFGLFGDEDCGRFRDLPTARHAVAGMLAIQPPTTQAVFLYHPSFDDLDLEPDVVVLSVRPVELTRLVQAHQFATGERVNASMGGVRAVNSDLIVRPYLTQKINVSTYCIGARLIAQFEGDRLGMGLPFKTYEQLVQSVCESRSGAPFHLYPGANEL